MNTGGVVNRRMYPTTRVYRPREVAVVSGASVAVATFAAAHPLSSTVRDMSAASLITAAAAADSVAVHAANGSTLITAAAHPLSDAVHAGSGATYIAAGAHSGAAVTGERSTAAKTFAAAQPFGGVSKELSLSMLTTSAAHAYGASTKGLSLLVVTTIGVAQSTQTITVLWGVLTTAGVHVSPGALKDSGGTTDVSVAVLTTVGGETRLYLLPLTSQPSTVIVSRVAIGSRQ